MSLRHGWLLPSIIPLTMMAAALSWRVAVSKPRPLPTASLAPHWKKPVRAPPSLSSPPKAANVPGAPHSIVAKVDTDEIELTWNADTGQPTGAYSVTVYPGGTELPFNGRKALLFGLDSGTPYTFVVCARNADGVDTACEASAPVTTKGG